MVAFRGCSVCKCEIDAERRENYTQTELCREHGKAMDNYGGEFQRVSVHERTSKEGSLKINYGGVSVRLKRNVAGIRKLREKFWETAENESAHPLAC